MVSSSLEEFLFYAFACNNAVKNANTLIILQNEKCPYSQFLVSKGCTEYDSTQDCILYIINVP